jgi:hypothetical protein
MIKSMERADRYRALMAACLGGLVAGTVLLGVYWYQVGTVQCDLHTSRPSHELLIRTAIVIGFVDLGVCAASWYPLRDHDSSAWAVINGIAAIVLIVLCFAVKYGFLRGGGC